MAHSIRVNGEEHTFDVDDDTPVLWVIRDLIGATGTKFGCGIAMCGACTVHVDGKAKRSCVLPIANVAGSSVVTIEKLETTREGRALQRAWRELDVVQCGYCQSGQLMSAAAFLAANPAPSDSEIDVAMAGNICRCGTYGRIRAGIHLAAKLLAEGQP
ncbi:MAG: (2Fe-2S)-binding protein [Kofleriaceae bacterium]